jgi:carbonic anhydrase
MGKQNLTCQQPSVTMKDLISGLRDFRNSYVSTNPDLFEQLSQGQTPSVLFITCSDSRLAPFLMTNSDLGDIFVIRNAGNIVPPFGAANGGEGATIEYAIHALGIEQIIVCGHSHCGAMKGLLQIGKLEEQMPLVYDWLRHADATRRLVADNYSDYEGEELLEITVAENVLTQIDNLKTYPVIRSKMYQGKLQIYAWVYYIETGEVMAYDPETHTYISPQSQLNHEEGAAFKTSAPPVACELPFGLKTEPVPPAIETNSGNGFGYGNGYDNSHHNGGQQAPTPTFASQEAAVYEGRPKVKRRGR